ncbi:MAG: class I SAM-dependent methyltransferase [Anaerolineaceae bacterium]|nr:class I SAM-dependent methyltransferase [Anaerolineaceae bacterium]
MQSETMDRLKQINQRFYELHAPSFSLTRSKIQPGVEALLPLMLAADSILDLGCGNGTFAEALAKVGFKGRYMGLDGSLALLGAAKDRLGRFRALCAQFEQADLSSPSFLCMPFTQHFPLITCFAALHHLPSHPLHLAFFDAVQKRLAKGGRFILSCWQISHSARLLKHIQDWSLVGLDPQSLEPGDLLMDWRGQDPHNPGLRYVHEFTEEELADLGKQAGLQLEQSFLSDGKEGNLALYQIWKKAA